MLKLAHPTGRTNMGRFLGVLVGVFAGIALSGTSLPAQSTKPDFSGTWTLVGDPGVPSDAPLWSEGVIVQGASKVTFRSVVPRWVKVLPPVQPSYWLDGQDSVSTRWDPRGTISPVRSASLGVQNEKIDFDPARPRRAFNRVRRLCAVGRCDQARIMDRGEQDRQRRPGNGHDDWPRHHHRQWSDHPRRRGGF